MELLGWDGAAFKGNLDEVQRLFRTGEASPMDRDAGGMTALLWAAWGKQLHVVQWLLREGGSMIDERDNTGWTALLFAAFNKHWDMVRWLLQEGGADVHDRNNSGWTALLYGVNTLHTETVQFLLRDHGADIADRTTDGDGVWEWMAGALVDKEVNVDNANRQLPSPVELADLYSVLRCYASPADPTAFIEGLECGGEYDEEEEYEYGPLPAAHRELLLQTERAHASPNLRPYRAQRLALLHEGTDFADIVIPDIQYMVAQYAQPTAEAQLSAAVIAEAAEAGASS
jgi:hypothetical protein